jgi:putative transcriptional regulator
MIPDELLFEYTMGTLGAAEAQAVEAALAASPELRATLRELEALAHELGEATTPLPPPESARLRLLEAVSTTERWSPFIAKLAELADLAEAQVRAVFTRAADLLNWEQTMLPHIALFHFDGGPRAAALDVGLVRVGRGMPSPIHRHIGDEWVLVLEGSFVDLMTGETHLPGDLVHRPPGSEHAFKVGDDADLVYVLVLSAGVELVGFPQL